eukprot:gnl/TRDRNA2_/TRDRNA2_92908_c0_seq2.p1 gnl/TRDRNA2_/TRDRNA2_92908_c0~~gnl/TRDRNA2_/TRDRNA2_92908_c0_seq2.p1  ORF type:complete len:313 (+),score=39.12 gnl/TRDRNA2_/TRDRNA2_92908_c0_seq2:130-1068(+)
MRRSVDRFLMLCLLPRAVECSLLAKPDLCPLQFAISGPLRCKIDRDSDAKFGRSGWPLSKRTLLTHASPCRPVQKEVQFRTVELDVSDMWNVTRLTLEAYGSDKTAVERLVLQSKVMIVYLAKVLLPFALEHRLCGLKNPYTAELLGIVDFSLQPDDGTREALDTLTIYERQSQFKSLSPYLCNLVVAVKARRLGLGKYLVEECEARARDLGYNAICLHCETTKASGPAMELYTKLGFFAVKQVDELMFMKKILNSTSAQQSPSLELHELRIPMDLTCVAVVALVILLSSMIARSTRCRYVASDSETLLLGV